MPLLGPVERRTSWAWLIFSAIYAVLVAGSVTMVYPFLLMLGASITTPADFDEWRVLPAYLTDDVALFRKWMDDRYGTAIATARIIHGTDITGFRYAESIPDYGVQQPEVQRRVDDWLLCLQVLPVDLVMAFNQDINRTRTTNQKFSVWLSEHYGHDIEEYNRRNATVYGNFTDVMPFEFVFTHASRPETSPLRREYVEFRQTLFPEELMALLATNEFLAYVERHIGGVAALNTRLATNYRGLGEVVFPVERPAPGPWRDLWDWYLTKRYPLALTQVIGDFDAAYRNFLAGKHPDYDSRVREYNVSRGTWFPDLASTTYPSTMPLDNLRYADWVEFTDKRVPPEARRLTCVETIWRDWLRERYGALEAVNTAHGTVWLNWEEVMPPLAETDVLAFWRNKSDIRREFLARNYRLVMNYVLFHGYALLNTVILVTMTVLGQLTVQPLAAYGLSRFRLRYSHRILLALLATMAFPAEVAMIPNFLLIRELGLLNTYWALVLPGLASGMGIFLLKGYFDSLPSELYEAAMMDGASELRMFWQITVPLAKPILAVIALGSFTAAYGSFLWAFLICQDPTMWTMMVFLWQLGSWNYPSVWMAALVIAAVPTLLVFIFCQNLILRGIIVPTMK